MEVTTATADVLDATARRIESSAREASRSWDERTAADESVWSEFVTPAAVTEPDETERIARDAEMFVARLAEVSRELTAEAGALTRASAFMVELSTAVESDADRAQAESLAEAAAETIAAASGMEEALHRVLDRAAETATLSAKTSSEAERGYRAVHRTLDEIERIRDLTEVARKRIFALGERVEGIGDVVRVIQEIAEKTNLLALNASIIAAQAGQHGRSFAVVAREIKALAQRTAASTKEISEQIRGVQEESERATTAMANGANAVQEGFQVAISAGDALTAIRESALTAQRRVQAMTRAYKAQSGATRDVVDLAGRVAERAAVFQTAARSQMPDRLAAAAAELQATATRIVELANAQKSAAEGSRESTGAVLAEVANLARTERELLKLIAKLQQGADTTRDAGTSLESHLHSVRLATTQLRQEIGRLQSP